MKGTKKPPGDVLRAEDVATEVYPSVEDTTRVVEVETRSVMLPKGLPTQELLSNNVRMAARTDKTAASTTNPCHKAGNLLHQDEQDLPVGPLLHRQVMVDSRSNSQAKGNNMARPVLMTTNTNPHQISAEEDTTTEVLEATTEGKHLIITIQKTALWRTLKECRYNLYKS
jgi:hypothetical protein